MVTGDHPITAKAIARAVGITRPWEFEGLTGSPPHFCIRMVAVWRRREINKNEKEKGGKEGELKSEKGG